MVNDMNNLETIVLLVVLVLIAALLMALKQIVTLRRDLHQAHHLLDIQQEQMRFWHRMATGGAFADFINSLDLKHPERRR
jgi:hypothetical protein